MRSLSFRLCGRHCMDPLSPPVPTLHTLDTAVMGAESEGHKPPPHKEPGLSEGFMRLKTALPPQPDPEWRAPRRVYITQRICLVSGSGELGQKDFSSPFFRDTKLSRKRG